VLDLSDEDIQGGVQDIVGVGVNWYLNPNMRVMVNYLRLVDLTDSGLGYAGEDPDMFQLRTQLNF
jgi:phosphate-selective porin OprO/OprP